MLNELLSPVCPPLPKAFPSADIWGYWVLTTCEQMPIRFLGQKHILHRKIATISTAGKLLPLFLAAYCYKSRCLYFNNYNKVRMESHFWLWLLYWAPMLPLIIRLFTQSRRAYWAAEMIRVRGWDRWEAFGLMRRKQRDLRSMWRRGSVISAFFVVEFIIRIPIYFVPLPKEVK